MASKYTCVGNDLHDHGEVVCIKYNNYYCRTTSHAYHTRNHIYVITLKYHKNAALIGT